MRETSAKQISHSKSFGQNSIGFSAGNTAVTAAVAATEWRIANDVNAISLYSAMPSEAQFNTAFALVRTVADDGTGNVTAATQGRADAPTNMQGMGPERLVPEGQTDVSEIASQGDVNAAASEAELAALAAYQAVYDLGDDGVVGGTDDTLSRSSQTDNGVAEASSDTRYAFAMTFTASGVTVGMGYDSKRTVSAGMGFSQGGIGTSVPYVKRDDGDTGWSADVSYTVGGSKLVLAYERGETDGVSSDALGVNFSHDLGGGANLVSGFGQVNDVNKANMGPSFKF